MKKMLIAAGFVAAGIVGAVQAKGSSSYNCVWVDANGNGIEERNEIVCYKRGE